MKPVQLISIFKDRITSNPKQIKWIDYLNNKSHFIKHSEYIFQSNFLVDR